VFNCTIVVQWVFAYGKTYQIEAGMMERNMIIRFVRSKIATALNSLLR